MFLGNGNAANAVSISLNCVHRLSRPSQSRSTPVDDGCSAFGAGTSVGGAVGTQNAVDGTSVAYDQSPGSDPAILHARSREALYSSKVCGLIHTPSTNFASVGSITITSGCGWPSEISSSLVRRSRAAMTESRKASRYTVSFKESTTSLGVVASIPGCCDCRSAPRDTTP